jgi:hypothetical protein
MARQTIPLSDSDPRVQVVKLLRGQTIRVPDLHATVYPGVFRGYHPELPKLRVLLDEWLEKYELPFSFLHAPSLTSWARWYLNERDRKIVRKHDMALLIAAFIPDAPLDRTLVFTMVMTWFLFWDDEIDCGNLQFDVEGTREYQKKTIAYLQHCLEPDVYGPAPDSLTGHNSEVFKDAGVALQTGQSDG